MSSPIETARLDAVYKVRRILTHMELETQEEAPCPECLDQMGGNIVKLLYDAFAKDQSSET